MFYRNLGESRKGDGADSYISAFLPLWGSVSAGRQTAHVQLTTFIGRAIKMFVVAAF